MKKRLMRFLAFLLVLSLFAGLAVTSNADSDTEPQGTEEGTEEAVPEEETTPELPYVDPTAALPDKKDPLNLTPGQISSNVFFMGESLSGMDYEDAFKKCKKVLDTIRSTKFVMQSELEEGKTLRSDYKDIGMTWDISELAPQLKSAVVKGNLLDRYKLAKDLEREPMNLSLNIAVDQNKALEYYYNATAKWNRKAKNAKVEVSFGNITVKDSKNGYACDCTEGVKELVRDIRSYDVGDTGEYRVPLYEEILTPEFTSDRAHQFQIIGSFTTEYPSPTSQALKNRVQNLKQSAANMSGRTFAPGEEISALDLYGDISLAGGYLEAGTFSNGGHIKEVGGGICQTTTTMYNAVLLAELEVTYRRNHSMLVLYVDPSRDAMVYATGNSDFKFKNTSSDYIIIDAYVNEQAETITVNIIGHEDHPADHSVRYESEILEITVPPVTINEDPSVPLGWSNVNQKVRLASEDGPTIGVKSRLWKITTDAGVETRTLVGGTDNYKPGTAVYNVASDTKLELVASGPRNAGYITLKSTFLDGTPLATDPALQTKEWRKNFNAFMRSKLGSRWPYTNDGYKADEPDGTKEKPKPKPKEEDKETEAPEEDGE
ncbi:MAG: VanW family protein [Lachnospiraceae bacterium]|nr:VanW family protein [Lachnospiraceae bacterium]